MCTITEASKKYTCLSEFSFCSTLESLNIMKNNLLHSLEYPVLTTTFGMKWEHLALKEEECPGPSKYNYLETCVREVSKANSALITNQWSHKL